ncbi:MAG: glycosyltransferase [Planctomycetes bacterium]|nr:glycosyltransferase [Planctomycetota bacterium]MBI3843455.1 glycosyltransferase [Planctomycetota bacterium]
MQPLMNATDEAPAIFAGDRQATKGKVATCDGVVCYAGVDWWYHNRGHSECQIISRLAKRVPVVWVNSIGMRTPVLGKTELAFRRYFRKIKSTLKGVRRDPSGMRVVSPLFIPRYSKRAVEANGVLLSAQVRLLCRWLGIRRPSAWVTVPTTVAAVERGRWQSIVFNRCDAFSTFPEVNSKLIQSLEHRLLDRADHVIYVNRLLYEHERPRVKSAEYIGHGVDFDHFARARSARDRRLAPDAILALHRPIIGYYGSLDDYTIDLDLLVKVARHVSPATLLLIGFEAMDLRRLLAEPNVVYLGPVPYGELPAYAAQFDVAIMPWQRNEWIEGCNPIKLKEYLALGFPIVTTRFRELEPYEHLVYAANTHEEFLRGIDRALVECDCDLVASRRRAVAQDSWDALADRVADLLLVPPSGTVAV